GRPRFGFNSHAFPENWPISYSPPTLAAKVGGTSRRVSFDLDAFASDNNDVADPPSSATGRAAPSPRPRMTQSSSDAKLAAAVHLPADALAEVQAAIREADEAAFLVAPRIVRRVIRHECDLPALNARVPHRKSFVLPADRLRQVVLHDELGL